MTKTKILLISFLLSLPFWFGVNIFEAVLEDIWLNKEIADNPQILKAQISSSLFLKKPEEIDIKAKAAISVLVNEKGEKKLLFSKNSKEILPIASLTKLMSAYIVVNYLDISDNLKISSRALLGRGADEIFKPGEVFKIKDLLYSSLVESENDGMTALAEVIGQEAFLSLMNLEAEYLGLKNTKFFNVTGLDPKNPEEATNFSTAEDMVILSEKIFENPLLTEMLSAKEFLLYTSDNIFHHKSLTTNKLLNSSDLNFKNMEFVAGKTGETNRAGGCLVLALKMSSSKGILINVILGSNNRFGEMKKLVDWSLKSLRYQNYLKSLL